MAWHGKLYLHQAERSVDRQCQSQPHGCATIIVTRQEYHAQSGPNADSGKERPQSLRQREKTAADCCLPGVRDKRRHHQNCGCLCRRHQKPQQPDRHGRQAKTDDAFDETRQQECARDCSKS
jgi:hypothetical protein